MNRLQELLNEFKLVSSGKTGRSIGLGVVVLLLALFIARRFGVTAGFLPTIGIGGITAVVCLVSLIMKRPLVAFTSYITRRWPLGWYWHPKVRPAYSEVTFAWAVFFGLRTLLQWSLFQTDAIEQLALTQLLSGWPATTLLLIVSYFYGRWRLLNLQGPSTEEFKADTPPPWISQKSGF
ncbi:MAG: DUF3159 domain-containing protein [Chloroflexota bacterium]